MTQRRLVTTAAAIAFAGAVSLALSACDVETTSTVYLSDLQAVAETGEAMAAPAVIAVEMPAMSTCEEQGVEVVPILKRYLHDATNPRCEKTGMNARLLLDFKAPLIPKGESFTGAAALMAVPAEGAGIELLAALNPKAIDAVLKEARGQYMLIDGVPDIAMAVDLVNDTRADAPLQIRNIFLAGEPVPHATTITVPHRDQARLSLSDVAAAAAAQGKYVSVATLMTVAAE